MKHFYKYSIFLLTIFFLMNACKGGKNTQIDITADNAIVFDTLRAIKIHHLENDSTNPTCSLKIKYVYPTEYEAKDILVKIQQELNAAFFEDERYANIDVNTAIENYGTSYIDNYKKEMSQFTEWKDADEPSDYYSYYKTLDSKILFNKANLLSYQISSSDFKGGANSSILYQCFVFNLATGNLLHESDIFITDYHSQLNALLIKSLMKQNGVSKTEDMVDMGYFGIEELVSNDNFYVDANGVTYIFNPGEYSALSIGAQNITISYSDLVPILKPDSPISILAES